MVTELGMFTTCVEARISNRTGHNNTTAQRNNKVHTSSGALEGKKQGDDKIPSHSG